MTLILIAIGAFVATSLGGLLALRIRDKLHLILGFSAGAVIGVAFFDLMPEALELAGKHFQLSTVTAVVAVGFVAYMIVDRLFFPHQHIHEGDHCENEAHPHEHAYTEVTTAAAAVPAVSSGRGALGAGSLSIHSFLDGIGIGLAFQVSPAVGLIVAAAVLAHDFSDGINTVSMIIRNGGDRRLALKWLSIDAIAPIVGIIVAGFIHVPEGSLGLLLAVFCGFFLYIGASDLLPESHHAHPTLWTTFATVLGVAVLYVAVHLAGL
jgi:zinc transporter ZupT